MSKTKKETMDWTFTVDCIATVEGDEHGVVVQKVCAYAADGRLVELALCNVDTASEESEMESRGLFDSE